MIRRMRTNHIARFEDVVQRLVEGTFSRLFAGRLRPPVVTVSNNADTAIFAC